MAVLVDLVCNRSDHMFEDRWSTDIGSCCPKCEGTLERLWTLTPAPDPGTHYSERVTVYESLKEGGKIQYLGDGRVPIPQRLVDRGYEKRELNVRDLAAFERKHNVMNERRHYDRNGRGLDD